MSDGSTIVGQINIHTLINISRITIITTATFMITISIKMNMSINNSNYSYANYKSTVSVRYITKSPYPLQVFISHVLII